MATEQDSFLAMIETKIAALQALAESYRAALSVGALGQLAELDLPAPTPATGEGISQNRGASVDLPVGVFRDKSIPDAIKLFLAAQRRKQTGKEITAGLRAGGLVSTASRFEATVYGSLHRLKTAGVVLRFKEGWDLAESYPENLRARIANGARVSKPNAKVKKKTRRRRGKKSSGAGLESKIEELFQRSKGRTFSSVEIGERFKVDRRVATLSLARMDKRNKATKQSDGRYGSYAEAD